MGLPRWPSLLLHRFIHTKTTSANVKSALGMRVIESERSLGTNVMRHWTDHLSRCDLINTAQKLPAHPILFSSQLGTRNPFPPCVQREIPSDHIVFLQSSVCEKIMELLGQNKIDHHQRKVAILSQDSFYKVLTPEQKAKAVKGQFNFDHPGMCTRPELACGRCVYYKTFISAACFLIASVGVSALAHPVFGAGVPLLIIFKPLPSAGVCQTHLLSDSMTECDTCYMNCVSRLPNIRRGTPRRSSMHIQPIKLNSQLWNWTFPYFHRCVWQRFGAANTSRHPAGEDCPDPSLWFCQSFQVSSHGTDTLYQVLLILMLVLFPTLVMRWFLKELSGWQREVRCVFF